MTALIAGGIGLLGTGKAIAAEGLDRQVTVDIPAQGLDGALQEFARQTKLQVMVNSQLAEGQQSAGLKGTFVAREALNRLLGQSGLSFHELGESTVTIEKGGEPARIAQSDINSSSPLQGEDKGEASSRPASTPGSPPGGEGARRADEDKISEVVVTAQRREQKLEDVPISISVFTGKELDQSSETSVNNMLFSVPGLNATTSLIGGVSKISIRGVNSSLGSNTVGYYVDGVPFGFVVSDFSPDPGTFDLDRVEVLRGPQGTLYGANSLNGVVRILTKDADLDGYELKGRTLASSIEGGGYNYGADAVVNAPIVPGKLAARLMLSYNHKGGYIDNFVADEIDDGKITNVRLKINAQPTEDLSVKLGYWRSRSDLGSLPISYADRDFYPGQLNPGKIDRFDVYSATMAYDFGSVTASNTASYIDYFNESILDWSAFTLINQAALNGLFYFDQTSKVFTNEFNLNSRAGAAWAWSAGAIYREAEDLTTNRNTILGEFAPGQNESTSSAIFGELTRYFANGALELTGGLRYFHDKVHQFEPGPGPYDRTSTFDHVSPRVVLTWHPHDDMTVYASYAQGFRSGLNQNALTESRVPGLPPAREDTLDNFEIGSKGSLFNRVSYEVAAYYIDWTDVKQALSTRVFINGVPSNQSAYVNAGTAAGPGVDVALTFRPSERLNIGLTGSWNDLHFTEDIFRGTNILYHKGDRLSGSAEYTFGGSIGYFAPLGNTGLEGGFSGSVNHKSAIDVVDILGRAIGDTITDSRLGVQVAKPGGWTFELFCDNVLNERGVAVMPALSETFNTFYNTRFSPRTIGAQFSFQF